jgi:hypothetical protein
LIGLGKVALVIGVAAAILAGIEYQYSTEMVMVMVVIMLVATGYIMSRG